MPGSDLIHDAAIIDMGQGNELLGTTYMEACFQDEAPYKCEKAVGGQVTMGAVVKGEDWSGSTNSKLKLL